MDENGSTNIPAIEMVEVWNLSLAEFEPERRIDIKHIADLYRSMQDNGYNLRYPIQATYDYIVGDGHRRLTCARKLHDQGDKRFTSVPVFRAEPGVTADQIWHEANSNRMNISSSDDLVAYNRGMKFPIAVHGGEIEWLEDLGGRKLLKYLEERGFGSNLSREARGIAKYCDMEEDRDFLMRTVYWLARWNMQTPARYARKTNADHRMLAQAVYDDVPIATEGSIRFLKPSDFKTKKGAMG